MSCDYASGLSDYEHKGVCGAPETFDTPAELETKINQLSEIIRNAKNLVVVSGAGISTSVGIPDFRGPNGVWTLLKDGKKPNMDISFDDAKPSKTHMALVALAQQGTLKFILGQNVDGLHLKSGFPLERIADLHGNMFTDKCDRCNREFIRYRASRTVGQKYNGEKCPSASMGCRSCRGSLRDSVLDWEDELPFEALKASELHCQEADVVLCLGSTLQILPVGTLPLKCKKRGGKVVICNLQPTKIDKHADLIIKHYVDNVMEQLLEKLDIPIPDYSEEKDPTRNRDLSRLYPKLALPVITKRKASSGGGEKPIKVPKGPPAKRGRKPGSIKIKIVQNHNDPSSAMVINCNGKAVKRQQPQETLKTEDASSSNVVKKDPPNIPANEEPDKVCKPEPGQSDVGELDRQAIKSESSTLEGENPSDPSGSMAAEKNKESELSSVQPPVQIKSDPGIIETGQDATSDDIDKREESSVQPPIQDNSDLDIIENSLDAALDKIHKEEPSSGQPFIQNNSDLGIIEKSRDATSGEIDKDEASSVQPLIQNNSDLGIVEKSQDATLDDIDKKEAS